MNNVVQLVNLEMNTEVIDAIFKRVKNKADIAKVAPSCFSITFKEIPVKLFLDVQLEVGCSIFRLDIEDKRSSDSPYKDSDTSDSLLDSDRVLFYIKKYL